MISRRDDLTLSAIVPVYNGARFLKSSLDPLYRALGQTLSELWVVDDASTDDSAEIAKRFGASLIRTTTRSGPAAARNLGAERARGDILVFIDADVVIHPLMLHRIRDAMGNPARTAIFGSYDNWPPETNIASLYVNLRHHLMHQRNAGATTSFWSGFGAVRRGAFLDLGGFDAKQFAEPSIEDIEFGNRLAQSGGRILLDPGLLCTHLKRWTYKEAVHTDCFRRALPWSRLMLRSKSNGFGLNVSHAEQLRAALVVAVLGSLAAWALGLSPWWIPVALATASLAWTRPLARLIYRRRGALAALGGSLAHQLYYVYSTAIYSLCRISALLPGRRRGR